jgi:cytochrome c oxidase assembly factor CtaG
VNLFDDPVTLAVAHPLLPVLVVLGGVVVWRGVARKRALT